MTDDVGFAASERVRRADPHARLRAAGGGWLCVFNRFHTTALCSPTRAALLTGRNHHTAGTGVIIEMGVGYPGYNSWSRDDARASASPEAQRLQHRLVRQEPQLPDWQTSQAGPFDLGRSGWASSTSTASSAATPASGRRRSSRTPRRSSRPHDDPDYHLDDDLADKAIGWLHMQKAIAPDKPFLLYYVPGHRARAAPRAQGVDRPFQGPVRPGLGRLREETFARQKELGVVPQDAQLTPRPEQIPAWDSPRAGEERVFARMMEVYAGALAHADDQMAASSTRSRPWASSTTR